jgi:hypothetical protein
LDLFLDYANNVKLYPAFTNTSGNGHRRCWRSGGRTIRTSFRRGREAFRRDIPKADVRFLDTGHVALETHVDEVSLAMRSFLAEVLGDQPG